jgi:2-alkyl-3-oxoalkanoate reductase
VRALVTGGSGFVGLHLVRRLREEGFEVRSYARREQPQAKALGAKVLQGDICDRAALLQAVDGCEVVFHLAAKAALWGDEAEFERTNVQGARSVMDACVAARVPRLVYTSTPSIVFDGGDAEGAAEELPIATRPLSTYARTKAAAERALLGRSGEGGVRVCALRPHAVFGPGDPHIVPQLVAAARAGRLPRIGEGTNRVDLTFVESAVHAHLCAARALVPGSVAAGRAYFISQGEPVLLWEWLGRLFDRLPVQRPRRALSVRAAHALACAVEAGYWLAGAKAQPPLTRYAVSLLGRSHWFDLTAARRDLGYAPPVSLEEGFERTVAHLLREAGGPR